MDHGGGEEVTVTVGESGLRILSICGLCYFSVAGATQCQWPVWLVRHSVDALTHARTHASDRHKTVTTASSRHNMRGS